jgi:hypothetical protein
MNDTPLIKKGTYRHYKNKQLYEVIGVALQTETEESLVLYRPLYEHDFGYELFARPYGMFVEMVELDGVIQPRFEKISD